MNKLEAVLSGSREIEGYYSHLNRCNCKNVRWELVNFSEEILAKEDENLQWQAFEIFLKSWDEQGIWSFLAKNLYEFRRHDVTLSTLLMDLLTILHYEICAERNVHWLWNFDKSTPLSNERATITAISALCRRDFTKLLLKFERLSSLPGDSPRLMDVMNREFEKFILEIVDYDKTKLQHITEKAINLAKDIFFQNKETEICKRMYFAIMLLGAVQLKLNGNLKASHLLAEEMISCLTMYFTHTGEDFISVSEVKNTLYACLIHANKLDLFNKYCEKVNEVILSVTMRHYTFFYVARLRKKLNSAKEQHLLNYLLNRLGIH